MKSIKKLAMCALALVMLLASSTFLAACKKDDERGSGGIAEDGSLYGLLNINVFAAGFGSQYVTNMKQAFEAKHDKVTVKVNPTPLAAQIKADMRMEKKFQKYDLYFMGDSMAFSDAQTPNYIKGYDKPFIEISDVYNHTPEGEDKTIGEKMNSVMRDYFDISGEKYFLSYGISSYGLTYIPSLLNPYLSVIGGDLPRTTDELAAVCQAVMNARQGNAGVAYPLIFSGQTDYWRQIFLSWWAQYEGLEQFHRYFRGMYLDPDEGVERYDQRVFAQPGRLKAYEEANRFIGKSTNAGVSKPLVNNFADPDSVALQFMVAQTRYMDGKSMMMVNGGWLENEMKSMYGGEFPYELDMLDLPVISAIRDNCPSIGSDAELSALIKAIDGGSSALVGTGYDVSQADFDKVKEARSFMYISGEAQEAIIPATTYSEILAKEFLKFMYSDEGIAAYMAARSGQILPVPGYDYAKDAAYASSTTLYKRSVDLLSQKDPLFIRYSEPVVYNGGITAMFELFEKPFAAVSPADRKTPQQIFQAHIDYYKANNSAAWLLLLRNSGVAV
jgi:ABC-type glycerol-3-phosphate transport system substrate-binding protein